MKRLLNPDVLFALLMLAVSVMFFAMGTDFNRPTADGSLHEGFFPQIIAVAVGIISFMIAVRAVIKQPKYFSMTAEQRKNLKMLLLSIVLFAVYITAWSVVHFIILTMIMLAIMCRIFKMSWKFTGIFSVLFSTGIYFLFTELFSVLL